MTDDVHRETEAKSRRRLLAYNGPMSGLSALTPNSSKHCGQDVTQARGLLDAFRPRYHQDATTAQVVGPRAARECRVGEVHSEAHDDRGQIEVVTKTAREPLASTAIP